MTEYELNQRAKQLWHCGIASIDNHNRAAWVRSVLRLGDKWLLAKPVARVTP
jgi:hypothetical protein